MALKSVFGKVVGVAANYHNRIVGARLAEHGFKLEDVYVNDEKGIQELAVSRLPHHLREARSRRTLRGTDISAKRKYLPKEHQQEDPFDLYLTPYLEIAEKEYEERRILNA